MAGKGTQKSPYEVSRDKVLRELSEAGLPWPKKPNGYGEEYEFPQDLTALSPTSLGKLQSRLAGWDGYAQRLIALLDVSLGSLVMRYNFRLNKEMAKLQLAGSKCKLKDTLIAQALGENDELMVAATAIGERTVLLNALKAQKGIYEMQRNSASREQSRRADDLRFKQT